MQSRLPEKCDLFQLAERGSTISGTWPIAKMPRLLEMLASDSGEARAEMHFDKEGRTRYVRGHVTAEVEIICQRCMDVMTLLVETEFSLALIETEAQIDTLTDEFEPLVTEGLHYLPDVIEDELILAIPIVPRHESDCSDYMNVQKAELEEAMKKEEAEEKSNPFAVLKDML